MNRPSFCTFWAGRASPYQTLCLASWVAHGFDAIVYTADTDIKLPPGATRRPAEEILDLSGHIHRYRSGFGAGSPSLHSNLFRYKLLKRGEWWLDTDVLVQRDDLPATDFFLVRQAQPNVVGTAVMRLPVGSPLVNEAVERIEAIIEEARWGQTGPNLISSLIERHGLAHRVHERKTAYEIDYSEVIKLFDPRARDEVEERLDSSIFVHLWNEMWNAIGVPQDFGPPEGSYLDAVVDRYGGKAMFPARIPFASIKTWWENRARRVRLEQELAETRAKLAAYPRLTFSYSHQLGNRG